MDDLLNGKKLTFLSKMDACKRVQEFSLKTDCDPST
jgi:hypothetical protein